MWEGMRCLTPNFPQRGGTIRTLPILPCPKHHFLQAAFPIGPIPVTFPFSELSEYLMGSFRSPRIIKIGGLVISPAGRACHTHGRHSKGGLRGSGGPWCSGRAETPSLSTKEQEWLQAASGTAKKAPVSWLFGVEGPPGQGCLRTRRCPWSILLSVFTSSEMILGCPDSLPTPRPKDAQCAWSLLPPRGFHLPLSSVFLGEADQQGSADMLPEEEKEEWKELGMGGCGE